MIVRTDPFRDLDRVAQQLFTVGTPTNPSTVAMDAYRDGETLCLHFDVPGMDPSEIALDVQRNVLTVTGERRGPAPDHSGYLAAERPRGAFRRQVYLGEALDTERIEAGYANGVLSVRIPVAAKAKPRRIDIDVTGAAAPAVDAAVPAEPALN